MYGSLFGSSNNKEANSQSANISFGSTQISLPPLHHQNSSGSDKALLPVEDSQAPTEEPDEIGSGATTASCVVNLANTIIGAGMLGLPGALGGTGYLGGTILMILGALFSAHGLMLLSKAAQQAGLPSSFYTVAKAAVPQYTILIDLAVALKCFGVATGYLITVGDCMVDALDHILMSKPTLEEESAFIQAILSRRFWVVGAALAVLPVSFYRTLDELKKASAMALVSVAFLVFGIVAYANNWADPCLGDEGECRGDIESFTSAPRTFAKLPIFVFAFTCHQNMFPIVNEIRNRSQQRLNTVIACAIGFALGAFLLVAQEGYRTFGTNVRGDILLNYPETGKVTILRICIAFMLVVSYPLQLDPSRRCISSLIQVGLQQWRDQPPHSRVPSRAPSRTSSRTPTPSRAFHRRDSDLGTATDEYSHIASSSKLLHPEESITNPSDALFNAITIAFLILSFSIAMVVDDLGVVLAMVGATGSTLVSYILPGLIYVKLHPVLDAAKVGAYIQLYMGCFIMPLALYFVLSGRARE